MSESVVRTREVSREMHDLDSTRRTALKGLALLGIGTTGIGTAAADEHHSDDDHHDDALGNGGQSAPSDLFVAHLGPQEDVDSDAQGMAIVQERQDGLKFAVQVSNLENAFMGHIHEDEVLGPIAVWLYDFQTQDERLEEGQFSGLLDVGTITDEAIAEGRVAEAESESVDDLIEKIEAGEAYVNIHTEEYPSGEIAGSLVPVDSSGMMPHGDLDDSGPESETNESTNGTETDSDTDTYG